MLKVNYFNYENLKIFKSSFGYEERMTLNDTKNKGFFQYLNCNNTFARKMRNKKKKKRKRKKEEGRGRRRV